MHFTPIEQFRIHPIIKLPTLFNINIDFTNSSLFMFLSIFLVISLLIISTYKCDFIPNKKQALAEMIYNFTEKMITNNINSKSAMSLFPFIFTLFLYILSCNVLGLMPYAFTVTSQIIVTFAIGVFIVCLTTVVGLYHHGMGFFKVFLPPGTPIWLMPLMIVIELVAYLARAVTLAIRLSANMIAGHTMLKVIALFVAQLQVFWAVIPFAFLILLNMLELFVSVLQAYIFTILTCIYLNSVINLH